MADDWENETESISQPPQPKPRILARPPQPQASAASSTEQNPRYDSAFPALGAGAGATAGQKDDGGDDDWFRGPQQNNRQLWDTANRAAPTILQPAAGPAAGPPPRMQILKRPSDAPKSRSATPQNRPQKSLTQREEEYRLARERIFGEPSGSGASGTSSPTGSQSAPAQNSQTTQAGQSSQSGQRDTSSASSSGQTQRDNNGQARDHHLEQSRDQSRESSVTGRRRGNATPRSGRASPDDLSRDMASLSVRGGRQGGPSGPAPVLRGGMSPGVLRQPRGPSGAGFSQGQQQQQQQAEQDKRKELSRSNSGLRRDDSFNRGPSEYSRNTPNEYSRSTPNEYSRNTPNEYNRNAPNEYSRNVPNEYSRNINDYTRSTGAGGPPPEFSRSSSYSSTTSQGSYGFPAGPAGFDAGRGYIGAVGGAGAIGSPYGSAPPPTIGGYPYQQYAGYQQQPGYPQHVPHAQQAPGQTGYYSRPPYAGQQLYGYGAPGAPGAPVGAPPAKNNYPYASGPGGGSFGVPGGPPGPPTQQPGQPGAGRTQPGQPGGHGQQQGHYYRGAAGYGQ